MEATLHGQNEMKEYKGEKSKKVKKIIKMLSPFQITRDRMPGQPNILIVSWLIEYVLGPNKDELNLALILNYSFR